jgi:beta-galactosidase/beta-glucuronidase
MNYKLLIFLIAGLSFAFRTAAEERAYLIPTANEGVRQSSVSLNGAWQFQFSPGGDWTSIQVPGEAAMQGYAIEHDRPFRYKKSFALPADYREKTIILRFDGVYSYARLWVNGVFVREHHGGFTRWETDVTALVKPEKENEIELEVTDRLDEISYASGYAHHPVGGILRDVTVFALPKTHVYDFHIETQLDSVYKDAVLRINWSAEGNGEIAYTLTAPDGQTVPLSQNRFPLSGHPAQPQTFPVQAPLKWDAEHPNLYTLTATIYQDGKEVSRLNRQVGFREIKIVKNQLLVNGQPVKLRGACRHDVHPTLGRVATAEFDRLDAVLFKQANMNFVRTSHYPSSETFVEQCDRLGIYVESETAVCFVATSRQRNYGSGDTQNNAAYAGRYLTQFQEMVKTFRSHPSVIIWSIGNENRYGSNFQQCKDWVMTVDPTRPTMFSYPNTQKDNPKIYDILSMHYPDVHGNLSRNDMPALYDEWAHVPCYTYATLRDDPNIRDFWGMSLDKMWGSLFDASGGLGGAIWGYIDETFMLPEPKAGKPWWKEHGRRKDFGDKYIENCAGYGEWGIVDVWRRQKPEFWGTKKAYSPVRLLIRRVTDFMDGERLILPVRNRFDHTNLDEITIKYTYRGIEKTLKPVSIAPHQKGLLLIPGENWAEGEQLFVRFFTSRNELIDACAVTLGRETNAVSAKPSGKPLTIEETGEYVTVKGDGFEIPFNKSTGLIVDATSRGETVIAKGPFLNLDVYRFNRAVTGYDKDMNQFVLSDIDWQKTGFTYKKNSERVEITLSGVYRQVTVEFLMHISPDGQLQVDYLASGESQGLLREAGVKFQLPKTFRSLKWKRAGYWSYYPEDSFSGHEGEVPLYDSRQSAYGQQPVQPWHLDTRNYY